MFFCSPFFFSSSCVCFSTAAQSDVRTHVLALLNRHSMVFGNYTWTEFDEEFLQKNVESVVLVDLGETVPCLFKPFTFANSFLYYFMLTRFFLSHSASGFGELLPLCSRLHPERGWTQHADSGGGGGALSSQSLVAASR